MDSSFTGDFVISSQGFAKQGSCNNKSLSVFQSGVQCGGLGDNSE